MCPVHDAIASRYSGDQFSGLFDGVGVSLCVFCIMLR